MTMKERIAAKLDARPRPTTLDIVDESDRHKGHAGAREGGETHYRVYIVSEAFAGKGRAGASSHGLRPARRRIRRPASTRSR